MKSIHASVLSVVLLVTACGRTPTGSPFPTRIPTGPDLASPAQEPNWIGQATVVSVGSCPFGRRAGETWTGAKWDVIVTGASFRLQETTTMFDQPPYSGTLTGRQFTAATAVYQSGNDACSYTGGTLSGSFSADFSSFEATETLVWGPAGQESTVQLRWNAAR